MLLKLIVLVGYKVQSCKLEDTLRSCRSRRPKAPLYRILLAVPPCPASLPHTGGEEGPSSQELFSPFSWKIVETARLSVHL